MLEIVAEMNCAHALDELRSELDSCSDTAMRNRTYAKINELEILIEKLLAQETKSKKKEE